MKRTTIYIRVGVSVILVVIMGGFVINELVKGRTGLTDVANQLAQELQTATTKDQQSAAILGAASTLRKNRPFSFSLISTSQARFVDTHMCTALRIWIEDQCFGRRYDSACIDATEAYLYFCLIPGA